MKNFILVLSIVLIGLCAQSVFAIRCFDCKGTTCTTPFSVGCRPEHRYCFVDYKNMIAGCATTCNPGAQTTCCTSDNCNFPQQELECYSCNDCRFGQVIERCSRYQKYCYRDSKGGVKKGCAETCNSGRDVSCCTGNRCNA